MPSLTRRSFLNGLAGTIALGSTPARADDRTIAELKLGLGSSEQLGSRSPPDFNVLDLEVEGDKLLARRFALFVPNHLAKDERVPLLVLLHGLGETWDTGIGVFAWVERYGLGNAYARLRRPPVGRTSRQNNLFSDAQLVEVNAAVAAQPFRGMAIACAFTPNIPRLPNPEAQYDAYAAWIADVLIPRARKEAPVIPDVAHTTLDGVSLGGLIGLEVFIRRPEAFAAWGGIQGALNVVRLPHYADRLAAGVARIPRGPRPALRIVTSDADPFKDTNTALSDLLVKKGVAHEFVMRSGLHDQLFLREAGSIEMLLWHDRRAR